MAKITFNKCLQDAQDLGSDDEFMVSRVYFSLIIDDKIYENLYADVKQAVGSNFEDSNFEVSPPHGYDGPLSYPKFRDCVIKYYTSLIGPKGRLIRFEKARDIVMRNNVLSMPMTFEI
ncbi:MAG TPA: hypothetical protein PLE04_02045 [Syntrophales bacterium]|nr:hypothetical protein [Syntrophales bacterium]HQN77114.1 hypothetical protein [Syntrophales bacterium]